MVVRGVKLEREERRRELELAERERERGDDLRGDARRRVGEKEEVDDFFSLLMRENKKLSLRSPMPSLLLQNLSLPLPARFFAPSDPEAGSGRVRLPSELGIALASAVRVSLEVLLEGMRAKLRDAVDVDDSLFRMPHLRGTGALLLRFLF